MNNNETIWQLVDRLEEKKNESASAALSLRFVADTALKALEQHENTEAIAHLRELYNKAVKELFDE